MANKLKPPVWFTREKYLEMKKQGVLDKEICEEVLHVSHFTFSRFKEELGVVGVYAYRGNNRRLDHRKIKKMYANGFTTRQIADIFNCRRSWVWEVIHKR